MLEFEATNRRDARSERIECDFAVIGGGLAGVCAAITASRAGLKTVLVQDRPVLGGNASSEVRLWALGATSHMGNNNRWSREGGVINELLLENVYRNPEGNPVIFDTVLLEAVCNESNLRLLLNTAAHDVELHQDGRLKSVAAYCSQNSTRYELHCPLFCDASGDGVVGFLAGAAFRIGAESYREFGELWAPEEPHQRLLGHSLYFYSRDTGKPVRFVAPNFALKEITQIPRYRQFNTKEHGCQLWWIEYGGSRDTVHETEEIKWELWKIVYGVWDHIKNSGEFPEAETLTLDWVGMLPGKRESRRFEGDYMLTQQDVVEQRMHSDAVSYGGWALDLHPVDAIYSSEAPCTQWHSKGIYQIPYRCLYSRNVKNLFLAGRSISASHIAFGSTRVMLTCAHNAQAVGEAAAVCREQEVLPAEVGEPGRMNELQRRLTRQGHYIPGVSARDPSDLAQSAKVTASSELALDALPPGDHFLPLDRSRAVLLPLEEGRPPAVTFTIDAPEGAELVAELRTCSRRGSFTLDMINERVVVGQPPAQVARHAGKEYASTAAQLQPWPAEQPSPDPAAAVTRPRQVTFEFESLLPHAGYAAVCLLENSSARVAATDNLVTGITTLSHREESRVAKGAVQLPPPGIGVDGFDFWTPERRPEGRNLAISMSSPLRAFGAANVINGVGRPTTNPNAWVAAFDDPQPQLTLSWKTPQTIGVVELSFDTDYDHALETVLMTHPESVMPHCVRSFRVFGDGRQLFVETENHQARRVLRLPKPISVSELTIEIDAPSANVPASLFEVRCYQAG